MSDSAVSNAAHLGTTYLNMATDYTRTIAFAASRERLFEAVTTIDGIQGWWSQQTTGSAAAGGEFRVEFNGYFLLRVDSATRPSSVQWTCIRSTEQPDWEGTKMTFDIVERTLEWCELRFRHIGLTPQLDCYSSCQAGWSSFLASLAAYVEHGSQSPFGSKW